MEETPDFLKGNNEPITQDSLETLKSLVVVYKERDLTVDDLEADLKIAKALFNKVSQEEIPNLLLAHGLSEIKLDTGEKVTVKEDVSVTISSDDKFFSFLKERDEDDIIKMQIHFTRMDSEHISKLFAFLLEGGYDYELKKDVHSATRKKYFKELLGLGKDDREEGIKVGKYLRRELVQGFAKLFVFHTTKIK